jgi:uncharacterized protein (DUF3084 family)
MSKPIEQIINEGNAIIEAKDNKINSLDEIIAERNHKINIQNKRIVENLSYQTRLNYQIENMQNTIDTCRQLNNELVQENLNLWGLFLVSVFLLFLTIILFV